MKFAVSPFAVNLFCVAVNTFGSSTKRRTKKTRNAGDIPTQNNARQAVSCGSTLKNQVAMMAAMAQPIAQPLLHAANRFAAMLRAYHFTHQDGARGPFAAEAKSHQGAEDEKLRVTLRKTAQKRKEGEPDDGDLQCAHAPETVGKGSCEPAAKGRGKQCHGADQPGIRIGDCEGNNDRRDREAKNLDIHGIEHPAAETCPECAFFIRFEFRVPTSWAVICTRHCVSTVMFLYPRNWAFACIDRSRHLPPLKSPPSQVAAGLATIKALVLRNSI